MTADTANRLAGALGMDEAAWTRHANPWSGWTRMPVLPLLALTLWSRVWIGWWCLLPLAALVVWTRVNPRAFPPPRSTASWMSRAVLGERAWLNAGSVPIPGHHARAARRLSAAALFGLLPLVHGLLALNPWATALGVGWVLCAKLWFLDRMTWLWQDMRDRHPPYRALER